MKNEVNVSNVNIKIVPVNHPVPAVGFILKQNGQELIISGDTGPTKKLWLEAHKLKNLKGILTEIAFPNAHTKVAEEAGHFTPNMFKEELKKIPRNVPIYIYHLKPGYDDILKREIAALKIPKLTLLKWNQRINF